MARLRAQSPGASSVGSLEDQATNSPRGRRLGTSVGSGVLARARSAIIRHSRDPRPVGDRGYAAQCARNVVDFLAIRGFPKNVSADKLLKDPSTKEFFDIFRFLVSQLDPQLEVDGKMEDEVPAIMRRLKYPVEVNRSKLQAISGPNTWPQLLAVLDWLAVMVRINDEVIDPVASCELGLGLADCDGDHHVMRSLHENYLHYLSGREDHRDEERLRQIYEERIEAIQGEIQRLEDQQAAHESKLQDYEADHEQLLELQKAPAIHEMDAQRLRGAIQSAEARVSRLEEDIAGDEEEERDQQQELLELQRARQRLAEQVESQAYSKRDIERLKCERNQLRQALKDLKTEYEKTNDAVWELQMQEKAKSEEIGRVVRHANEMVELLGQDLTGEEAFEDFRLRIDLSEPVDSLADLNFDELRARAQVASGKFANLVQIEEGAIAEVLEAQRKLGDEFSEKDRECRRLRARLEQLNRVREELRSKYADELDDAQRTTTETEDAVHEVATGAAAPSLRDAADVDRLRMMLTSLMTQAASAKAQMEEQNRRDEERFEEYRRRVIKELDGYAKAAECIAEDIEIALDEDEGPAFRRGSRAARGGC